MNLRKDEKIKNGQTSSESTMDGLNVVHKYCHIVSNTKSMGTPSYVQGCLTLSLRLGDSSPEETAWEGASASDNPFNRSSGSCTRFSLTMFKSRSAYYRSQRILRGRPSRPYYFHLAISKSKYRNFIPHSR